MYFISDNKANHKKLAKLSSSSNQIYIFLSTCVPMYLCTSGHPLSFGIDGERGGGGFEEPQIRGIKGVKIAIQSFFGQK